MNSMNVFTAETVVTGSKIGHEVVIGKKRYVVTKKSQEEENICCSLCDLGDSICAEGCALREYCADHFHTYYLQEIKPAKKERHIS